MPGRADLLPGGDVERDPAGRRAFVRMTVDLDLADADGRSPSPGTSRSIVAPRDGAAAQRAGDDRPAAADR